MVKLWRNDNYVAFHCPGCEEGHTIPIEGERKWGWNGSMESPTFTPSILCRGGHFAPGFKPGEDNCWCTYNAEHPNDPVSFKCVQCHSYVTDGKIQFLRDSTHKLSGQTVELPNWDEV